MIEFKDVKIGQRFNVKNKYGIFHQIKIFDDAYIEIGDDEVQWYSEGEFENDEVELISCCEKCVHLYSEQTGGCKGKLLHLGQEHEDKYGEYASLVLIADQKHETFSCSEFELKDLMGEG